MGRRTRKSVAALAGSLPACDPARPRSAGAGFGSKGRRRAAWDRPWAPRSSGHGMRTPALAGALARADGGDVAAETTGLPSRGATVLIGTAPPARSRPERSRDRCAACGSPPATATVVHSTSVWRRRQSDAGLRREGRAPRAARRGGGCREACKGPGPAARVPGARRPAGPARCRGLVGPEVDKREVRRAHRDAARILEAQNEVLYAEERANFRPRENQEMGTQTKESI